MNQLVEGMIMVKTEFPSWVMGEISTLSVDGTNLQEAKAMKGDFQVMARLFATCPDALFEFARRIRPIEGVCEIKTSYSEIPFRQTQAMFFSSGEQIQLVG